MYPLLIDIEKIKLTFLLLVQLGTIFWVGFVHIPGRLKEANISKVPITMAFHPTQPRNWLISFWELDVKWIFVAIPFGFLTMLLFYYDHVCLSSVLRRGHRCRLTSNRT